MTRMRSEVARRQQLIVLDVALLELELDFGRDALERAACVFAQAGAGHP